MGGEVRRSEEKEQRKNRMRVYLRYSLERSK